MRFGRVKVLLFNTFRIKPGAGKVKLKRRSIRLPPRAASKQRFWKIRPLPYTGSFNKDSSFGIELYLYLWVYFIFCSKLMMSSGRPITYSISSGKILVAPLISINSCPSRLMAMRFMPKSLLIPVSSRGVLRKEAR